MLIPADESEYYSRPIPFLLLLWKQSEGSTAMEKPTGSVIALYVLRLPPFLKLLPGTTWLRTKATGYPDPPGTAIAK